MKTIVEIKRNFIWDSTYLSLFASEQQQYSGPAGLNLFPSSSTGLQALSLSFNCAFFSSMIIITCCLYSGVIINKCIYVMQIQLCICEHIKVIQIIILFFTAPTVTISSGTPVRRSNNTFGYPILSRVTLTCMVDPSPSTTITYLWNTTGCYTNTNYYDGHPRCFPANQTTSSVTGYNLIAKDAGSITCTVTIKGVCYTSGPLTLRISGRDMI